MTLYTLFSETSFFGRMPLKCQFCISLKQEEIASLKEQVASRQDQDAADQDAAAPPPPGPGGHASSLEIVQKELAAHKEVVAELRAQLEAKEAEFQVKDPSAST